MNAREPARVLLVRLSALGDVVLATAAGQALTAQRPDVAVTFVTRGAWAPLIEGQPWATRVWTVPDDVPGAQAMAPLRDRIAAEGFLAHVDLQTNRRSRALLRGLPRTLAWPAARWQRRRWVSLRFTRPAPVRPAWLRFVDALAPLGVVAAGAAPPRLEPTPAAVAAAEAMRAGWGAPAVFLAPGSHWATKRWPEASFLAVGRAVAAAGGRVLVGGDVDDRGALPALAAWVSAEPMARWFAAPLPVLAELVRGAQAAVTNDTGLMHVAAAVGVPVVAVFGSTHPALGFAPAGAGHAALVSSRGCQPCTLHGRPACPLGHHGCVTDLTPERVLREVAAHVPGLAGVRAGG
jgi:heptosyltransferase-2